jgi:hypothetical protein
MLTMCECVTLCLLLGDSLFFLLLVRFDIYIPFCAFHIAWIGMFFWLGSVGFLLTLPSKFGLNFVEYNLFESYTTLGLLALPV